MSAASYLSCGSAASRRVRDRSAGALARPPAAFVRLSGVAFATGSFWGTSAIALPIVIPLAESVGGNSTLAIAAVVSAGGFGYHACFFGDTTVLASQASGCDNLAHSWSQLPYALLAAALSIIAFLAAGLL